MPMLRARAAQRLEEAVGGQRRRALADEHVALTGLLLALGAPQRADLGA